MKDLIKRREEELLKGSSIKEWHEKIYLKALSMLKDIQDAEILKNATKFEMHIEMMDCECMVEVFFGSSDPAIWIDVAWCHGLEGDIFHHDDREERGFFIMTWDQVKEITLKATSFENLHELRNECYAKNQYSKKKQNTSGLQ